MKRIFPYYKDQELSGNGFGYASLSSAKKYMNVGPLIQDYEKTLPEDYWTKYEHVYRLETPWQLHHTPFYKYKELTRYDNFYHFYLNVARTDNSESIPMSKLPRKVQELYDQIRNIKQPTEKRNILVFELLCLGYHPNIYKDRKDYDKGLRKFKKENIKFVEKEITIG